MQKPQHFVVRLFASLAKVIYDYDRNDCLMRWLQLDNNLPENEVNYILNMLLAGGFKGMERVMEIFIFCIMLNILIKFIPQRV